MTYSIRGLASEPFVSLWSLDAAALAACNIRRVVAGSDRGFPRRISLQDANEGEALLLLPHAHHEVAGPYRASGPIYIRQHAQRARFDDEIPPFFRQRLLSVRAYDVDGWMQQAEVVEGVALEAAIEAMFACGEVAYLHIHNARPGCFAARVDRA